MFAIGLSEKVKWFSHDKVERESCSCCVSDTGFRKQL